MAYETGIISSNGYIGVLEALRDFVTKANSISSVTDPDPANTGQGTVTDISAEDTAPSETWTLTCTVGGATGTFSVVGSVSGAQADATVGTPYDNDIVAFTINDGDPDFIIGDDFEFTVTEVMGTERWTVKRDEDADDDKELILMAPGSEGSVEDEYYVGIKTFHGDYEGDPYYNWQLNGFTGYNAAQTFYEQPGSISASWMDLPLVLLEMGACEYWFVANGRRIIGCIKVGTIYAPFYLGLLLPYGTPNTLPYPLVIGGSAVYYSDDRLSSSCTYYNHRGFIDPYALDNEYDCRSSLKFLNGVWISFGNQRGNDNRSHQPNVVKINNVWPGVYSIYSSSPYWPNELKWSCERNIDGTYPLFPLILMASQPHKNIFGELDGVFTVWGDRVITEDDIIFEGKTYKVFQNCFRTYPHNFWAMRLE